MPLYRVTLHRGYLVDIEAETDAARFAEYEDFLKEYSRTLNNFTQQFITEYCVDGVIDWEKIIKINSALEVPKKLRKSSKKKS